MICTQIWRHFGICPHIFILIAFKKLKVQQSSQQVYCKCWKTKIKVVNVTWLEISILKVQIFRSVPIIVFNRGVGSPPVCRWKFGFPLNFLPLGLLKLSSPWEAIVILVPTNCQVGLTAILCENSSAYKLLKVSRVIYDFKIALNKVKYSKNLFDCPI